MKYKQFIDNKAWIGWNTGVDNVRLNTTLFDFQKRITRWACKKGRCAIFADTGLGKTLMQCEWAKQIHKKTNSNVLILAPLSVAHQTVNIAKDLLNIDIQYCRSQAQVTNGIVITNYEMFDAFDVDHFNGIVLDEASILKNKDGKTRRKLVDAGQQYEYRLCCTATPSPNDFMELGNQAEFLGIMTTTEMLAMFFVHDGGETQKWRLKGHGQRRFWEWMSTWSVVVRKPSDIGGDDVRYELPDLNYHEHVIHTETMPGELFPRAAQNLMEQRHAKRASISERVDECASMINSSKDSWIIWCHLNDESALLASKIPDAKAISGSDSIEYKEQTMDMFTDGELRVLVTKPSIAGFGMNWQHCNHMAFVGMDHSFERFYQAVRRVWRFGQTKPVDVHIYSADTEGQIMASILRKEKQHEQLHSNMVEHMKDLMKDELSGTVRDTTTYETDVVETDKWTMYLGDCIDVVRDLSSESIDYTIFSPPFSSLYTYSNSDRDMGNSRTTEQFMNHFDYLIPELLRVTRAGRLLSFHCMNLPTSKVRDGYIGLRDFRGELIRAFVDAGWIYHSEVCIWKDPVTAMQRTKALGLLHKQIKKDACMSRQGIADYLVTMRKPGENTSPVKNTNESLPVSVWQNYASPIWMDIKPNQTLEFRSARENQDERHICPLQLEVIERAIELWTNDNDLVLSPFAGIGSEGYVAVQQGRRFIGVELKRSYYERALKHLKDAKSMQTTIFEVVDGLANDKR